MESGIYFDPSGATIEAIRKAYKIQRVCESDEFFKLLKRREIDCRGKSLDEEIEEMLNETAQFA